MAKTSSRRPPPGYVKASELSVISPDEIDSDRPIISNNDDDEDDDDDDTNDVTVRKRRQSSHHHHHHHQLNADNFWRVIRLGQRTQTTFGDSGWVNGSVVSTTSSSGDRQQQQSGRPSALHGSFAVATPLRDEELCGSMPNVVCSGRASVSCLELRDLSTPVLQDYVYFYQNPIPPPPPDAHDQQLPSRHQQRQLPINNNHHHHQHHHYQRQRLSQILDFKARNLSKYHAASLAKAARQISSRDSDRPLPKKARWLIIVIGIIMFGMSMLLVGITLRLAPMIDEIVRKEHEDLLRKMNQSLLAYHVNTTSRAGGNSTAGLNTTSGEIGSGNSGLLEETEVYHIDGQTYSTEAPWPPEG